ncbi:MAG: tetratricopeptide repeat protein, partial [Candidatus Binatia bacterium]
MGGFVLAVFWLLLAAPVVTAEGAAEVAASGESAARAEAMRRYEALLVNNSPALEGRRDEIQFRLGLLHLEDAQAANPSVGVYGARDRYERALSLFQQVLSKPGTIFREDALYYQAIAFEELGRGEQALANFRLIAREFPASSHASEIWFRLGNDAVQKNRVAEAANDYQEVLRRNDPRYRDQSAYMYAWSAFSLRQTSAARTTLMDLLGRIEAAGQQQNNLYPESVELLAKVIRSEGTASVLSGPWVGSRPAFAPVVLKRTADLYRETSAYREAAMAYEQLMRDYPDPASADATEKLVIECYLKAGEAARAQEARERLIAQHMTRGQLGAAPADLVPFLKDSALYLHHQARDTKSPDLYRRAVEAYRMYASSLAEGPARSEALFWQAEASKETGDWNNSAEGYKIVAEARDPAKGEESAFRRIALLEDAKTQGLADVDRVLAAYEDYFKLYPGGAHELELRTRQAGYLFDQKRYTDSLQAGVQAVTREPDPAKRQRMKLMLARAAFAAGDYFQCANWARQLLSEGGLPADMRTQGQEVHAASILKAAESLKDKP